MFFLGASAHILIYLLVPAFLIVCFCFNGQLEISEATNLSPVVIVHQPQTRDVNWADTYVYCVTKNEPSQTENLKVNILIPSFIFYPEQTIYQSPEKDNHALRAPPAIV